MRCLTAVLVPAVLALATVASPTSAQDKKEPAAGPPESFESPIINNKGDAIGKLWIRDGAGAMVVRITIQPGGLTPGWHGMHFHMIGDCSDTAKFEKSKGHINHDNRKHGLLNPDGPEEADLPNLYAGADGSANVEATSESTLSGEDSLKDADGSALVIHANEDDHTSQPIGNAGARVGCSVIK